MSLLTTKTGAMEGSPSREISHDCIECQLSAMMLAKQKAKRERERDQRLALLQVVISQLQAIYSGERLEVLRCSED